MGRWWTTAAALTVLVGAVLTSARDTPAEALTGNTRPSYDFVLSAESITGLYPGVTKNLRITAQNPTGSRIVLTQIRAEIIATSRRRCSGTSDNLTISRFTGRLPQLLDAHRTKTIGTLPVSMPLDASGNCPATTFTIKITGTAQR
jgi:hypothetical protein